MTEVSIQTFQDRVADAPLAASQITVPIAEAKAVAAVLADLPGPLSDKRWWQEMYRDAFNRQSASPSWAADEALEVYQKRFREKPELQEEPQPEPVEESVMGWPVEDIPTAANYTVATPGPQPERRELEWKWDSHGMWYGEGVKYPYAVNVRLDGKFQARHGPTETTCLTLSEAQAWCQEQEDKLLAEQEGPEDA